jgi:hypothetical protein
MRILASNLLPDETLFPASPIPWLSLAQHFKTGEERPLTILKTSQLLQRDIELDLASVQPFRSCLPNSYSIVQGYWPSASFHIRCQLVGCSKGSGSMLESKHSEGGPTALTTALGPLG